MGAETEAEAEAEEKMRTYWDTSALINAFVSAPVWLRLEKGDNWTRLHTFSEAFATLTGKGMPAAATASVFLKIPPADAARLIGRAASFFSIVELTKADILAALDSTQRLSIVGARIHDFMHVMAADAAKADLLVTRNTKHFAGLGTVKLDWP